MTTANLTIAIGAELTEIRRALQQVNKDVADFKKQVERPSKIGVDASGLQGQLRGAINAAKGLFVALASLQTVRSIAEASDQYATLSARLKLATRSQEEFTQAQQGTFALAQETRTSLGATIDLYARLERSTRDLQLNQATILQLTKSINQAAQISGGGPGAEAAIFQLSQGLASGVLRGEELNSVLEQAPRLAQAIADGLNVPIGKLRELGQQGKITAADIAKALLSQREILEREFAQFPNTLAGAFTQLRNSFVQFIGQSQEAGTATRGIVEGISALSRNLPAVIEAVVRLGIVWGTYWAVFRLAPAVYTAAAAAIGAYTGATNAAAVATGRLAAATTPLVGALKILGGVLVGAVAGWQIGTYLREQFLQVELFGIAMVNGLLTAWERLKLGTSVLGSAIVAVFKGAFNTVREVAASFYGGLADSFERIPGELAKNLAVTYRSLSREILPAKSATEEFAGALKQAQDEFDRNVAAIDEGTDALADYAIARRQVVEDIKKDDIVEPKASANESALRGLADDAELASDDVRRALAIVKQAYDDNLISIEAYYNAKRALELADIDAQIRKAQAEAAAATTQQQQTKALTEIIKLQRERASIASTAAREQAKAEEELASKLEDVQIRTLEAEGRTAEARSAQLQREFRDLIERLKAEGNTAGVELVNRLINVEAAKGRFNELKGEIQTVISDLRAQEQALSAQADAGLIGPVTAEERLQEVREKSLEQLKRMRDALKAAYDQSPTDEALRELTGLDTEIARVTASTQVLKQQFKDAAIDGVKGFFTDLVSGAKSAGEAFADLARNFARMIADIVAQKLAAKAIDAILSFTLGVLHSGGMAGTGPRRAISPLAFLAAPRYHNGGMVGLGPNEVPAILQKGEEVLAKGDPRNAANGGGSSGYRIVNVVDPRLAGDYLESAAGEQTILNVIGRNPGQVRQLLGG